MAARKLVVGLGERRRSAHEVHGGPSTANSVASQLLARYRRASLQDGARRQTELYGRREARSKTVSGTCQSTSSVRSSVSTDIDEEERVSSPQNTSVAPEDGESEGQVSDDDEAQDIVGPLRSETSRAAPPAPAVVRRRKFGTILREHPQQQLYLFREEAEYSDYVDAMVTGVHTEMDSVVFYEVEVHLSQMKWKVLRRFSEFRKLRQRLLKHLTRRQRCFQPPGKCMICANILQTIEQVPFPSRQRQRQPWFSMLRSRLFSRKHKARSVLTIADRKRKLQDFVGSCLLTIRGLRQHSRLMCDSSTCEISVSLRMIEEFLGLSFTRYMRFLNERGVLDADDEGKPTKGKPHSYHHHHRNAMARHAALRVDSAASRRATIAV